MVAGRRIDVRGCAASRPREDPRRVRCRLGLLRRAEMAANFQPRHPADAIAIALVQPLDGDLENLPTALGAVAVERLRMGAEDQAAVLLDLLDEPSSGAVRRDEPVGVTLDVGLGLLAEGV